MPEITLRPNDELIMASTGTKNGMTTHQYWAVKEELKRVANTGVIVKQIHNGLCQGADEEFLYIAKAIFPEARLIGHPGANNRGESPTRSKDAESWCHTLWPEDEYLARDRVMASLCGLMIGTPCQAFEVRRSGTWTTLRAARSKGKPLVWFRPDGTRHTMF